MAEYQLLANPLGGEPKSVLRVATGEHIPFDPANRDYQEFLAWKDEGNTPDPAPPPSRAPAIKQSAQSLQIQQAQQLAAQGRTNEALAAVLTILGGT